jgi:NADH:ubiquinone oxidoreductase subunit E
MPVTTPQELRDEVTALVDKLGPGRSSLIPILQEVKRLHQGVDNEAMQVIAEALDIHPVEVYSVASFYAFLHGAPEGQFVMRLCGTLSCDFAGKDAVAAALTDELGIGFDQSTDDGRFTLEWASCVGMCDQGPALLVNDKVHTRVTPESVRQIVADCRLTAATGRADA